MRIPGLRRSTLGLLPLLLLLGGGFAAAPGQEVAETAGPHVVVCLVEGMIDDGIGVVVKRAVREAEGAEALILEIDTPGGRVDSAIEITNDILEAKVPTIAYVKGMGAISAGALISYACDTIVMSPATNIGASTPVMMGGAETSAAMNEKSMSFVRARYRALGEAKGHNPLLGEAMVDPEIEVRGLRQADDSMTFYRVEAGEVVEKTTQETRGGREEIIDTIFKDFQQEVGAPLDEVRNTLKQALRDAEAQSTLENQSERVAQTRESLPDGTVIISRAGELLTLTSSEAQSHGLSSATVSNLEELLGTLKLEDVAVVRLEPTWSEALFRWLTNPLISSLLLMLGFGGLYMEIRTPGFGLPGIVGLVCLGLFFGSYVVIGVADWVDVLLVVLGLVLIVVELFVLPGFGFIGVAGGICLMIGLYLSMVRVPIPEFDWHFERLRDAGQTVTLATILFGLSALLTWKFFPKTPFYSWLILSEAQQTDQGYVVQTEADEESLVGLRGVTASVLRPAGRGRFQGRTLDIMTRGEFIEANRPVVIVQAEGNRIVVAEVQNAGVEGQA